MSAPLSHSSFGPVLLLTITRTSSLNSFDSSLYLALISALTSAAMDDAVGAVVLTSEGNYFSSGADIQEQLAVAMSDSEEVDISSLPPFRFMQAMLAFPKPLVAAVNGPAIGIGVTLLLHCDLVIAAANATFWVPFARAAIVPEFASSKLLPATCGLQASNELLLLGRKVTAERAREMGIVTLISDAGGERVGEEAVSMMRNELLEAAPHGAATGLAFVALTRLKRAEEMGLEEVCREEMRVIEKRMKKGQVMDAAMAMLESKL
jgi:enoyl-CoA hydratase/carnithine racemase